MGQDIKFNFKDNLSELKIVYDLDLDIEMYKIPKEGLINLSKKYPVKFYPINVPNKPKYLNDAHIYWGNRIEPYMLELMPKVDWVHFGSVGTDRLNPYSVKTRDLTISSSKGLVTNAMISYVVSLMGVFSKRLDVFFKDNKKPFTREIYNNYFNELKNYDELKVLIIGLGNIGLELAKRLNSLGVVVDAVSRKRNNYTFIRRNFRFEESFDSLNQYDFIVSLLPDNNSTRNMINFEFFQKMSPTSSFINIGRGSTVNENDLVSALDKNLFCRAILDVSKVEPLEESSILFNNSKIFLSPHIAAFSPSYWVEELNLFEYNLRCYINNEIYKMKNLVK
tara:strand:+ start:378 stop:1385 length:1008 start_codon:yes stop_codon:yes gene_type:complete